MGNYWLIATARGLQIALEENGVWRLRPGGLQNRRVTSIIAREGVILAGTTAGVFRSDDLGVTWQAASAGLDIPYVRWMAFHPAVSDREFAGTEAAGIFVSHDGARSWRACPEVAALRDRLGWRLPYSPRAGCIRGFAFHGPRAYAAAEVGGLLRSDDAGETWRLAGGSPGDPGREPSPGQNVIHPDVHSVEVHPSSPDLLFAPTGGGFYCSADGGDTWELRYDCYCRAVWADPADPDHLLLGPADGVDRRGRIEETRDGGRTWQLASTGLDTPWPNHMVERFTSAGDTLLAVLSNGELMAAPLAFPLSWEPFLPQVQDVLAVFPYVDE